MYNIYSRKKLTLVLLGLDFKSSNLGCSALAFSFLDLLDECARKYNLFMDIISVNYTMFSEVKERYQVKDLQIHYKNINFYQEYTKAVKNSNLVIDFTGGDSFTDLYGRKRFYTESFLKEIVIAYHKPLVLGPQTIGPFKSTSIKKWAAHILDLSDKIYVRDNQSANYVEKISKKGTPILMTDIAFLLKKGMDDFGITNDKINIGINVSGLLWNGGYDGGNQFHLSIHYRKYCKDLIEIFSLLGHRIHLIAHVFGQEDNVENDYSICKLLAEGKNDIVVAPYFSHPGEAKKYISQMDFFIGARMHATIASYSTGVPVVPVAYSRKFSGLYDSLNYPYMIDARVLSTEDAISRTLNYFERRKELKNNMIDNKRILDKNLEALKKSFEELIVVASNSVRGGVILLCENIVNLDDLGVDELRNDCTFSRFFAGGAVA